MNEIVFISSIVLCVFSVIIIVKWIWAKLVPITPNRYLCQIKLKTLESYKETICRLHKLVFRMEANKLRANLANQTQSKEVSITLIKSKHRRSSMIYKDFWENQISTDVDVVLLTCRFQFYWQVHQNVWRWSDLPTSKI